MVKRMYGMAMAVGLLVMVGLVAGCGSSDSETASAPLTKAEFIKQAEAICTKANKEEEAAAAAWTNEFPGGVAEAEEHADEALRRVVVPALRQKAEGLEALVPPAKDEAAINQMIQNLSAASKELAQGSFEDLFESGAVEFKQEATEYGLKSCGSKI